MPRKSRERGEDTRYTSHYICTVFDETDGTFYIVGGQGQAEVLVDMLKEEGHSLYKWRWEDDSTRHYKIVEKNGRTRYGVQPDEDVWWDQLVVLPGEADFRLTILNLWGRQRSDGVIEVLK